MAGPAEAAGYVIERERGAIVVALPSFMRDVMPLVRQHGTLYDAAAAQPDAQSFTGRGAAYLMPLGGCDCIVRHYRRGGLVARVLHDEYVRAGEPRPLRELHASIAARARGVDTPEVVTAITYLAGPLYRADLVTRFMPDSRDLAAVTFGDADPPGDADREFDEHARTAAWYAAGRMLRAAFGAGVEHADLNLRNILIANPADAPRALLLDLDRAVIHDREVSDVARSTMLKRLHRSRRKLEYLANARTTAGELAALDEGLAAAHD